MGELFRSEDMLLCQLYLQSEASYACVSQLGELGIVQFRDLNEEQNAFTKKFVNEIRRCEEMERQLRYFEKEAIDQEVEIREVYDNPEAPAPRDMIDLEAQFEKHESELKELSNNIEALSRNYTELYELKFVLRYTEEFMMEAQVDFELSARQPDGSMEGERRTYLGYIAGVIPREKLEGFMRMLWFACRGNVFVKHVDIEEPLLDGNDQQRKSVFMVFFQGEQLKTRVRKICEGYRATLYPCPDSIDERREMALGVLSRLQDLDHVLTKSKEQKERVLETIAENLNMWYIKVLKIKSIYHTLNMFHTEGQNYVAEGYLPMVELGSVQQVLNSASESIGISAPSLIHPIETQKLPTYFKTNKFTDAFQKIIDAYGVACYKEVNPAPFALISFPFLFSVMFGDAGHGLLMFLFALWMVLYEKQIRKTAEASDMFSMIYGGRYVILLMSIFAIYSGLIYNDVFSKSINIFGSGWNVVYDLPYLREHNSVQLDPANDTVYAGMPYPFGLDPIWQMSENKITFTNSYKEKISVILGVSQMLLGIILSLYNHIHFKKFLNVMCDFIPALLFLLCMFGYMDALIITKWLKYDAHSSNEAPNILIGYINMFLFSYPDENSGEIKSNLTWFPGQKPLQMALVVTSVLCAAWMLMAKPFILRSRHNNKYKHQMVNDYSEQLLSHDHTNEQFLDIGHEPGSSTTEDNGELVRNQDVESNKVGAGTSQDDTEDPFDFGEMFIIQAIHTIEFCLGCVSHTASYLRLWALSLAHNQLSEVLWDMVLANGLGIKGYAGAFAIFLVFPAWAFASIAILLVMEGLSAFLHTLRLHWVEFQSKFYTGDGFPFEPFSFQKIIKASRED